MRNERGEQRPAIKPPDEILNTNGRERTKRLRDPNLRQSVRNEGIDLNFQQVMQEAFDKSGYY